MHTVLVVDDEAAFLASIAEGLSSGDAPCHVLTACDGAAAIDILSNNEVAIVMSDLKMPNIDGFQLLAWLALNRPGTPVIVMTAFGTPTMHDQVVDRGALHFIEKPFDVSAARRTIHRILENRESVATIALPDLLRMVMLDRRAALVHAGIAGERGSVAITGGRLVGARLGALTDAEAVSAMRGATIDSVAVDLVSSASADHLRAHLGLTGPAPDLRLKDFLEDPAAPVPALRQVAASLDGLLSRALELEGAVAASIVNVTHAEVIASCSNVNGLDITGASRSSADMVRSQQRTLHALGIDDPIEDLVVTAATHIHVVRPLRSAPHVALCVVWKRDTTSVAFARMQMAALDGAAA